jgi:Icc-related predicted phosphoesterase
MSGYRFVCTPWAQIPEVDGSIPHVVLCHAPPESTLVSCDLGHEAGDPEVAHAIHELPKGSFSLSGHVHNPKRWYARLYDTYCFNPGFDAPAVVPNHIIIDTVAQVANFSGWGRELGPIHLLNTPSREEDLP